MTRQELVDLVTQELNSSYALPTQLQPTEIERIIKQTETWFYENYGEAVQSQDFIVAKAEFYSEAFKKTGRTVKMPECVVAVTGVRELNGSGLIGNIDRDFSDNKLIASEMYLNPFTGDSLVFRVAQYQFYDLTKAFFLDLIAYDYNRRTRLVKIKGRDPRYDVIFNCEVKIPEEDLYEDYYFQRYVTAQAKVSLGRQLSLFNFQLMGDITVNGADLKSEGNEEITNIKQEIQDQQPPIFMLTYH